MMDRIVRNVNAEGKILLPSGEQENLTVEREGTHNSVPSARIGGEVACEKRDSRPALRLEEVTHEGTEQQNDSRNRSRDDRRKGARKRIRNRSSESMDRRPKSSIRKKICEIEDSTELKLTRRRK